MPDITFIVLTLLFFGVAHIYVTACDKLKVRPKP